MHRRRDVSRRSSRQPIWSVRRPSSDVPRSTLVVGHVDSVSVHGSGERPPRGRPWPLSRLESFHASPQGGRSWVSLEESLCWVYRIWRYVLGGLWWLSQPSALALWYRLASGEHVRRPRVAPHIITRPIPQGVLTRAHSLHPLSADIGWV